MSLAAPITIPTSLLPGQQYRLAFVTQGTRDATSTSIAVYDAFVTAEANTEVALSSISWQVLGSTAAVSARDHTGTAPGDYPGVPIFLLNDVKLVDDYADLWDGSLDTPLQIDQHGVVTALALVWTGTDWPGTAYPTYELGGVGGGTLIGDDTLASVGWIRAGAVVPHTNRNLYGLSGVLVVPVPEPSTTALLTLGFAALLLVRRVRAE